MMFIEPANSPLQEIKSTLLDKHKLRLLVKRDDLLHPLVSGNKWRKLKYNLQEVSKQGLGSILSFGGAYSNHIYSLAAAGKIVGIKTIGVIRGEELDPQSNPTLKFASSCGMKLKFVSREKFREKYSKSFTRELEEEFGSFFLLPEGGSNALALPGCAEIVAELNKPFDYICSPCGTGGTIAGISSALNAHQTALGFSVLKAPGYIKEQVFQLLESTQLPKARNLEVIEDYHFGGYGKITRELIAFMESFENAHGFAIEPVYSAKMFYGIFDLANKGYFPTGSEIVAVHTGGLQGLYGMESRIRKIMGSNGNKT
ncbi:pyridoxal-phosphate dependent enzyme [Cytophagaceae bacterium ABcell3]|nr:pyridoxal-phosphate dependent enzyme [Cytophagaceae bacterium ABcell3]